MGDVSHIPYVGRIFGKEMLKCLQISTCFRKESERSIGLFDLKFYSKKEVPQVTNPTEIRHSAYKEHTHLFQGECVFTNHVYANCT